MFVKNVVDDLESIRIFMKYQQGELLIHNPPD